ncbi:MAG: anhydro-N-acetylmuramic acid kinase [Coxiellaceae bacterium]|nr:anhydro-N-acetylmuramic acid kinase [Coxiellaceae bacterium]
MPAMNKKTLYTAIGTMSGTSMDGVDVAMIRTNGMDKIESLGHVSLAYPAALQGDLKQLAQLASEAKGDVAIVQQRCDHWAASLQQLTQYHAQAIEQLMQQVDMPVDVVGFHGQTLYHAPHDGLTLQVGDADYLSRELGLPLVHQFRMQDVSLGGQGAPLAPAYHQALVLRDQLAPAVVINCGGISNVTVVEGSGWDQVHASDIGPGNGLIDRLVMMATNGEQHYDKDGCFASQGQLDAELLHQLWQTAVCGDTQRFADKPWPKSLDIHDLQLPANIALQGQGFYDACYTMTYFTADMLVRGLLTGSRIKSGMTSDESGMTSGESGITSGESGMTSDESGIQQRIILAGGGWNNPVLLQLFKQLVEQHLPQTKVLLCDQVHWQSQAIEAEIFAYLAVRRLLQLPASGPYTTGVSELCLAGELVK